MTRTLVIFAGVGIAAILLVAGLGRAGVIDVSKPVTSIPGGAIPHGGAEQLVSVAGRAKWAKKNRPTIRVNVPIGRTPSKRMNLGRVHRKKSRSVQVRPLISKNGKKPTRIKGSEYAVNKPVGDNARKGAVKKHSQFKTKLRRNRMDQAPPL
jgi:hypothetical protein